MANLLSSTIGSHVYGSHNQSNILLKTAGNAGDGGILLHNSAGAFKFQIYGNGTDYGFLNGSWAGWDIRKTISGAMYMNNDNSYYLQTNSTSNFVALNIQGSAVIHAGNIGSQSVNYATSAGNADTVDGFHAAQIYTSTGNAAGSFLGGHYSSGGNEKPNSATFGGGKLKIAMLSGGNLGFGGPWNDVLWISSYSGGDVKSSHALVFDKYSSNVWVSDQPFDSASWGTGYLFITSANIASQSVSYATSSGNSVSTDQTNFAELFIEDAPVATKEYVTSQGYLTSLPSHNHDDRYYTESESDSRFVNATGDTMSGTLAMHEGAYYGTITFGSVSYWRTGISQRDAANAELRIWAKGGDRGSIYFATNFDGESGAVDVPPDGMALKNNNLGIGGFTNVEFPSHKLHVKGTAYATSDFRAPIFYDSGDTNYYVDPNSISRIDRLQVVGAWGGTTPNDGQINIRGTYPSMTFRNTVSGNMWLRHMDGAGDIQHYFAPSGVDATDWSIKHSMRTDGTFQSNGSMRAPIFYDSQDTGFYVDPNSESKLYRLNVGGSNHSLENTEAVLKFRNTVNQHNYIVSQGSTWGSWNQWIRYVGDYNTWRIGTYDEAQEGGISVWRLSGRNRAGNSELNYIVAGPRGAWGDSDRVVLWNPYARYSGGSYNGDGTHYEVITAANIGSQSVSYASGAGTSDGLGTSFLGNGSTNISSGYSRVIRNENGAGGNLNYAPVLHLAASDTMWQIAGGHGGSTNLQWRSGYAGTWSTPWWTILHSGNFTSWAQEKENQRLSTGDTPSFADGIFGTTGGATDQGIKIRYQNYGSGYGRIRFYQSDSNHSTIHSFSNSWQSGSLAGHSTGAINISGNNGVTFGDWNNADMWIDRSGNAQARGSLRAPIFYDSADTGYYGDFAGFSRMSEIGVTNNYVYNYFSVESSRATAENGHAGIFRSRQSSTNYIPFSFQSQYGNHSWGQIARFHIEGGGSSDRPSIQFSSAYNNTRWNIGYCTGSDDHFRITQNMGHRPDMSGANDGFGTERFRINTDGTAHLPSTLYTNEISHASGRVLLSGNLHIDSYNGNDIYMNYYSARGTRIYVGSGTLALHVNTDGLVYMPTVVVNSHSDNTKGYRIHNTSGTAVSAMFTNSANALVIGAGAFDQVQLNKKTLISGAALGVNVAASATAGRIDASNDIVAFSSSDERLKHNIAPIENALDKVKSLTGVEFDWKPEYKHAHGYEGHDTGIIAQQVQDVIPSAVRTNDTGFLAVRYEKLIGLLIEGMKEQQAQIDELKAKLDGLTK